MPTISLAVRKYRSIAFSICSTGPAICNMTLPYLWRFFVDKYSWRGTYILLGGFILQTMILNLVMTSFVKNPSDDNENVALGEVKELESFLPTSEVDEPFIVNEDKKKESDVEEKSTPKHTAFEDNSRMMHNNIFHRLIFLTRRVKTTKWRFLCDFMYLAVIFQMCVSMAFFVSVTLVMMDYGKNKGFTKDTGVSFFLVAFVSSLFGRILIGLLNLIPFFHSIILMGGFGAIMSLGIIMLGSATDYAFICALLGAFGIGAGGVIAMATKCVLDVQSVDLSNFPLALGLANSLEGIFDFIVPILIGHAVDTSGSYNMILLLLGSISAFASIFLIIMKTCLCCRKPDQLL